MPDVHSGEYLKGVGDHYKRYRYTNQLSGNITTTGRQEKGQNHQNLEESL